MQDGKMLTKHWTENYHKTGWIKTQEAVRTQVGRQGEEAEAQETTTLTVWFLKGPARKWQILAGEICNKTAGRGGERREERWCD